MNREEIIVSIRSLFQGQEPVVGKHFVNRVSMPDLADAVEQLPVADASRFLLMLPDACQPELFVQLEAPTQDAVLEALPRPAVIHLFDHLPADDRADIYKRMGEVAREKLLPALAKAERDDILNLASYEEGTVGSITTSDYATVHQGMTAADALRELRIAAPDKETIYVVYVLDDQRRLVGSVSLREIVLAPETTPIDELMHHDPAVAYATAPREEAARMISRHSLLAVPVVDADRRMIGIVTVDDAFDAAEEESTEDFHKTGGMAAQPGLSVRNATVPQLYRKRAGWLVVLVFGNLLSGAAIAHFESTIAAYIALVFFMPLLIGSGGNAGSQAATLMVRALATGDVVMKDWIRMLGREFATSALLGITMAVAVSGIGFARGGPDIALVVASSMILIVVIGSIIGMSLPFVLERMKLDPATASAPLITSIADAAGITIYLAIALMILGVPGAA